MSKTLPSTPPTPPVAPHARPAAGRRPRPAWSRRLLLAAALLLGGCGSAPVPAAPPDPPPAPAPGPGAGDGIPVVLENRGGTDAEGQPLVGGLPVARGRMQDPPALDLVLDGGERLPVASGALARWDDGSVRWLGVELFAPALPSGSVVRGELAPRAEATRLPEGELDVRSGKDGLRVETGAQSLRLHDGGTRLFTVGGGGEGGLSTGPVAYAVTTSEDDFAKGSRVVEPFAVERSSELSVTLKRVDELVDGRGTPAFRVTSRLTAWRGRPIVRLQQTLEVLWGVRTMERWNLEFPVEGLPDEVTVGLADGGSRTSRGSFRFRQVAHDRVDLGSTTRGRLSGAVHWAGGALGAHYFWQLFPTGIARSGDALTLELASPGGAGPVTLEEGFGRTHTVWLAGSGYAPRGDAMAGWTTSPVRPRSTAEAMVESEALGPLVRLGGGGKARFGRTWRDTAEAVFRERDRRAEWNYGIQHFGDFFDRESTLAYYGHINQEYDPAVGVAQLFAATGDAVWLERVLELAWHYADVDTCWDGGSFQHRATFDHLKVHLAALGASEVRRQITSNRAYDGTLESILRLMQRQGGPRADRIRQVLEADARRGVSDADLQERLFLIGSWLRLGLAQGIGGMEGARGASGGPAEARRAVFASATDPGDRRSGAELAQRGRGGRGTAPEMKGDVNLGRALERLAGTPAGRRLGLTDPDRQFADFFRTYGGSWEEFPSFHVTNLPIHGDRHIGSHSLIEGVVLAYWLTGEPRFREVATRSARYHVEELVPAELDLHGGLLRGGDPMHSRALGWPLINLTRLWEMTQGMPGQAELHGEIRRTADRVADFLRSIPVHRHIGVIHIGVSLEGLANYARLTGDRAATAYLLELARHCAGQSYDWKNHTVYRTIDEGVAGSPASRGLPLLGFAYALSVEETATLERVTRDMWANLPELEAAKGFAMAYRNSPRALHYLERMGK